MRIGQVVGALAVVLVAPAVAVGVGFAVFSAVEEVEPLPETVGVHPLGPVELSDRVAVHVLVGNRSAAPLFVGRTDVKLGVRLGSVRRPVSDAVVTGDAWTPIEPGETGVLRIEGPIPEELAAERATCPECTAGLQIQVRLSGDQGAVEVEAAFKHVPWAQGVQDNDSVPSTSSE
ncbi:MAG: hypothetical protein GY913_22610 [Proteobacteria bacterium]|nr:hypothetical protein [Pseudomonadota bacterium]MCP4919703.1 hypothetical protein [Pseudomonadota bacterium]